MAGIPIHPDCKKVFEELKAKKLGWVTMRLAPDRKSVIVDQTGSDRPEDSDSEEALSGKFRSFLSVLPPQECRYGVYDFFYPAEGTVRNKLVFVFWAPETAKTMEKVPFAATKVQLKESLNLSFEVQATDPSEIDFQTVLTKVLSV